MWTTVVFHFTKYADCCISMQTANVWIDFVRFIQGGK